MTQHGGVRWRFVGRPVARCDKPRCRFAWQSEPCSLRAISGDNSHARPFGFDHRPRPFACACACARTAFSKADSAAIFKAAGFKLVGGKQVRCADDVTASYMPGFIEAEDLNGDGKKEAFVRESSLFCYGNTAEAFVLVGQDAKGEWKVLLDQVGMALVLDTKVQGRLEGHRGWWAGARAISEVPPQRQGIRAVIAVRVSSLPRDTRRWTSSPARCGWRGGCPHFLIIARVVALASSSGTALSLWLVGIMPIRV
jgi:hypothetical protein